MNHARTILTWTVAAAIGAGVVLWVEAAPVFDSKIDLPDEVVSLAGIGKLRIDVKDMPRHPATKNVNKGRVIARCEELLTKGGLEVTDDPEAPVLTVGLWVRDDGKGTDALALVVIVGVYQPVHIDRLGRQLVLPTTSLLGGQVARPDDIERMLFDELTKHVTQITWFVEKATEVLGK